MQTRSSGSWARSLAMKRSLMQLVLTYLPLVLQSKIDIKCYHLKDLRLEGIRVDTVQAAENLVKLITQNKSLTVLHLNRMGFTKDSLGVLLSSKNVSKLKTRLFSLKEFVLAGNRELSCSQLFDFVSMAVGNPNTIRLKKPNLSQNDHVRYPGWSRFLIDFEMLRSQLTGLIHYGM